MSIPSFGSSTAPTLAVIGGGPKALALAAKARVLDKLGIATIRVVIIEQHEIAANWRGKYGFTTGDQGLGTSPEKDVGFPYRSMFGLEVDREMLTYSWTMYQVSTGRFGEWVDRGRHHPTHREWAQYLEFVFAESAPEFICGTKVDRIQFSKRGFNLLLRSGQKEGSLPVNGVVFTGPGIPKKTTGATYEWTARILHGQNIYLHLEDLQERAVRRVAVIGGGETSASAVLALLDLGEPLEIDIIYRGGAVFSRGESYAENHRFTDPSGWTNLALKEREEFIQRTDRGVFSVAANEVIDEAENVHIINGEVIDLFDDGETVQVELRRHEEIVEYKYDVVVVAIGYEDTVPFTYMPNRVRRLLTSPRPQKIYKLRKLVDEHLRIPHPLKKITGEPEYVNLHFPMLAGLSQGPGFPNLSCLGVLSDRILGAYLEVEGAIDIHPPKT